MAVIDCTSKENGWFWTSIIIKRFNYPIGWRNVHRNITSFTQGTKVKIHSGSTFTEYSLMCSFPEKQIYFHRLSNYKFLVHCTVCHVMCLICRSCGMLYCYIASLRWISWYIRCNIIQCLKVICEQMKWSCFVEGLWI